MEVVCSIPLLSNDEKTASIEAGGLSWDYEVTASCLGGFRLESGEGANSMVQKFFAN